MRNLLLCVLVIISAACRLPAADDALISVEAEGTAVVAGDAARAEDEALADAKRNAVEQAVGVFVKSEVAGADYRIIRDTILTRSEGYIARWERIEGSRRIEDGMLRIRIRADVGLVKLVDELSDIEEVYNAMQRPRIAVHIDETNLGKPNTGLSSSGLAVIRALRDRGFDVVDDSSDAEIVLTGNAASYRSSASEHKVVVARLDAKLVYAGTGDILFIPKSAEGRGSDSDSPEKAGRNALEDAGRRLISEDTDRFASQVLAKWALEVQNGQVFRVVASGLSYEDYSVLKKAVLAMRGTVGMVRETYKSETATLDVRSTLPPDLFRERLIDLGIRMHVVGAAGSVTELAPASPGRSRRDLTDDRLFDYPPLAPPRSWRRDVTLSSGGSASRSVGRSESAHDDGRWLVTLYASGRD